MKPLMTCGDLWTFIRTVDIGGDFCFISLMGRATYIWAEDKYELHVVKYSKPNRKR